MSDTFFIVPIDRHNQLVEKAYMKRGYSQSEAKIAAEFAAKASWHGIRTHNAIKALHLDHLFGSGAQGCKPNVSIEKIPGRFKACEVWNANRKLGQAVAEEAMARCIELADEFGVGTVSVDNAFHYLWGGGYVMETAKKGYIAYTNCTAALAEVVPFMGKNPTLGTNPHSWGFPTTKAIGFPIVIDWATSVMAMGRVQQFKREKKSLPENVALDANGSMTTDPDKAVSLMTFGGHKGYSMALINEIVSSFIGGSLPTLRSIWKDDGEKHSPNFFFQVIHPEALSSSSFAQGRNQIQNVEAVIKNILSGGNENCLLPGELEARAAAQSEKQGGLLFSEAEIEAFNEIAEECNEAKWELSSFSKSQQ